MRRTNQFFILFCTVVFCSTWINYRVVKHSTWVNNIPESYFQETCVPFDHVVFLKTHKCGSSTIQNILMRRGLNRNLNFVLPKIANYLGYPEHFDPAHHLDRELTLPEDSQKFDIFTHHTRYNSDNIRLIMESDAKRITILRNPATLFESLYSYYDLSTFQFHGLKFQDLVLKDKDELWKIFSPVSARFVGKIGINQMAFDMGMEVTSFNNTNEIQNLIEFIDKEFDFVMISEYMEASLVLLADFMCWSLKEVSFLKVNSRPHSERVALDEKSINKLHELNNVDSKLYNYFLQKFKLRIKNYGIERMQNDVSKLIHINSQLLEDCVSGYYITPRVIGKTYRVINFNISENASKVCKYAGMNEIKFTELLRNYQISKYNSLKRLQNFIKLN